MKANQYKEIIMFTESAQELNEVANFYENHSLLSPINDELEVEMQTTDLIQTLDNLEKKVVEFENQIFFSSIEIRDSFLDKIREFYLIINELDYNILRIEGLTIQEKLSTIESIEEQIRVYLRRLENLENNFENEIKLMGNYN
jgi:DNA-directed RNA polymerase subunit L